MSKYIFFKFNNITKHSHTLPHTFEHKYTCIFFQVSAVVKSLQVIYADQDEEATNLFKVATNFMMLYNKKLQTMSKTRQLIQDNMAEDDFEIWNGKFIQRKPMELQLLDIETVSIVIFLKFFKKLSTKHYRTILHTFELLFSGQFS